MSADTVLRLPYLRNTDGTFSAKPIIQISSSVWTLAGILTKHNELSKSDLEVSGELENAIGGYEDYRELVHAVKGVTVSFSYYINGGMQERMMLKIFLVVYLDLCLKFDSLMLPAYSRLNQ